MIDLAKKKKIPKISPKKNIPNQNPKTTISRPIIPTNNGFSFYSVYPWIRGTDKFLKKDSFTNYCKDAVQFAEEMKFLFNTLIPKLYEDYQQIFKFGSKNYQYPHCHTISGDKLDLCVRIANEVHQKEFDTFEGDNISWWQIGLSQGIRLIGLYNKDTFEFFPLFVDRHHLIFPNVKYNQSDFDSFKYNPS